MKTPSFFELQTIVESISDELEQSQLQEVYATEDGLVLCFYRFQREPRMTYLVFDLNRACPILLLHNENLWLKFKKTKPVSLFLNSHAKNQFFTSAHIGSQEGRVVHLKIGLEKKQIQIEFRAIPKQPNFIVKAAGKTISWSPVLPLAKNDQQYVQMTNEEDVRSLNYLMKEWKNSRFLFSEKNESKALNPFEKWIKKQQQNLLKKSKAVVAIETQIASFKNEEWSLVGEHIKNYGLKNLKPEWSVYINYEEKLSYNIQKCFEKAKAAQHKIKGAAERLVLLKKEVLELTDLSESKFQKSLILLENKQKKAAPRDLEGRLRKMELSGGEIVAYMGKSAVDNIKLLKQSKPHDLWMHLKDYPSAHAIIHRLKNKSLADEDIFKVAQWLLLQGLSKSQAHMGGKYAVVCVECRHVKPLKGDKMGRVTYHNAREILIAL